MTYLREFPYYIITRGAVLSILLLAAVPVLLAWVRVQPAHTWLLYQYADYLQTMSAVVLGAGLLGGLALEDVLRRADGV